jgi:hypothetical protein
MRVLFGMVLGALLIVSVAFIADSWSAGPSATTTGSATGTVVHRPMVNWDVVGENLRIARERVQEGWDRLSQKIAN